MKHIIVFPNILTLSSHAPHVVDSLTSCCRGQFGKLFPRHANYLIRMRAVTTFILIKNTRLINSIFCVLSTIWIPTSKNLFSNPTVVNVKFRDIIVQFNYRIETA